ncbi:MAG: ATP phosphoribosyltransferase regulatory subunit, partial [Synergistaceae bacterium]|nr:ATP phosphoribosyltransferase regulatory subunit [Synergistaceae bacterium]
LESSWDLLPPAVRSRLIAVNTPYGEPCCLRGDITLATLTYLASHYAPEERPLRICYSDRIYMKPAPPKRGVESFQIGAELLGWEGHGADVEMLSLLLSTLDASGLDRTVLVLGDATLLSRALLPVDSITAEKIASALSRGALPEYFALLEGENIPEFYRNILLQIPDLRGGAEILDEGEALWKEESPLSGLRSIVASLTDLGYGNRVIIDLSLARELAYYSGPIFDVYSPDSGRTLGGGGRYDRLLSSCGMEGQAMGFALDLEAMASLSRFRNGRPLLMAWYGKLSAKEALERAEEITAEGMSLEMSWAEGRETSLEAAKLRGFSAWTDLSTGTVYDLSGKENSPC